MTKINVQICSNCGKENFLHNLNCTNCKHYLRSVQPNIDFWSTAWSLFDSPKEALKKVIFAEHKNFSVFLVLLLSFKIFLNTLTLNYIFNFNNDMTVTLINSVFFIFVVFTLTLVIPFFLIFSLKINKIQTTYKNNLALIGYSSIPIILSSFILIPVEYGIFGQQWFIGNPSPLSLKPTVAYILLFIEFLMLGWSLILFLISNYIQTNSFLLSGIVVFIVFIFFLTSSFIIINILF